MSRLGRPNGQYAWNDETISIAYSLVCEGKTQPAIIAEAVQSELPEIRRSSLSHYLSYFSTKYNYPPAKKGMSLPWEGFTYDGIPIWEIPQLQYAYQMVVEGRKTDSILQEAKAAGLLRINTKIFWKYMSWLSKHMEVPFPRKPHLSV
jgi:hypothetical protein